MQNDAFFYFINTVPSHWKLMEAEEKQSAFRCEITVQNSFIIIPFTVFLKERSSENRKDRVFIKKILPNELLRLENPVFITVYVTDEKKAFWEWKHSAEISEGKESTVMVSIPRSKSLQERNWHIQPEEDLKKMFMEENFLFGIPDNKISEKEKQAWEHFFQKNYTEALECFQLSEVQENALLRNGKAVCLWKTGRTAEAVSMMEKAVHSEGSSRRLKVIQAYILSEYGITERDIKSLKKSLSILNEHSDEFSDSFFFHYCRGRTSMEIPMESSVDSISEMHSALRINPKFIPAKIALGICYDSPYAPEAGMPGPHDTSYFDEVLSEHPNQPEAALWKYLSFCKLQTQTKEHLETLVKILEENPTLAKIYRDSLHWIEEGCRILNEKDLLLKYNEIREKIGEQ